jgi:Bacterial protein of unknown function (DUF922)
VRKRNRTPAETASAVDETSEAVHASADSGRAAMADEESLTRLAQAPVVARAAALARLQRGIGNATLARRIALARTAIQRQETSATDDAITEDAGIDEADLVALQQAVGKPVQAAPPAAAPARPAATSLPNNCADCKAAAAILNSGAYVGEANVQVAPAAGEPRVIKGRTGYTAEIDISWPVDMATSSMEITDFVWPNMTDADKAAVAAFRAALVTHEEGHFAAVEAALATLPKTISATGATGKAAMKALQAKVTTQIGDGQTAIDKAKNDYDAKTKNGKNQAAVGGTNVTLTCPGPTPTP